MTENLPVVITRPDWLETARKVIKEYHPDAAAAFVAGSAPRGEVTPECDLDIIVIYESGLEDVHRHSVTCDGWPIDMFVHSTKTTDYYMSQDAQRGSPALPTMIVEGIELPAPSPLTRARKERALSILALGPPALDAMQRDMRRYTITAILDDIAGGQRSDTPVTMSLALLYQELADFYLRAHGKWSGRGKSLFRALERECPDLAPRYEKAFIEAFSLEGNDGVFKLADEMLFPFGGRFWAGLNE